MAESRIELDSGSLRQTLPGVADPEFYKLVDGRGVARTPALTVAPYTIQQGDTVWQLLRKNGFQANGDILGVVKALNADMQDLNALRTGDVIELPAILGAAPSDQPYILVDKPWRLGYGETIGGLEMQRGVVSERFRGDLSHVEVALRDIDSVRAELPGDFVDQVRYQADLVRQLQLVRQPDYDMQSASYNGEDLSGLKGLSPPEIQRAYEVGLRGVLAAGEAVKAGRAVHRKLTVRTIDAGTGERRCRLSIFFASEFDYMLKRHRDRKKRLPRLSSPAEGPAAISELRVWAEWPGDNIVSENVAVNLLYDDVELDLPVRDGAVCP